MTDTELLARIVQDPSRLGGNPVIVGTRLSVEHVLNRLAHGEASDDILAEYPGLSLDDLRACMLFASRTLEDTAFFPAVTAG